MSITFKFLLNKRRANSQGEYPIVVRIFKDRLYKEYSLPFQLKETHWDDKTQTVLLGTPQQEEITTTITSVRNKIRKHLLLAELDDSIIITPQGIVDSLKGRKEDKTPKHRATSIITYTRNLIQTLTQNGKVGNAMVYTCAINKFRSFVKTDNFPFESLTYKKLDEFHNYLVSEKIKVNTISIYMRTIRAIYNRAIKEGVVPVTFYPFTGYRVKNERTPNRALTVSEMQSIINLTLPVNTPIWHWRNYFLLSFCLCGINFADLLKLTPGNIIDDRVVFRRSKTGKLYSIKLQLVAKEILTPYLKTTVSKSQFILSVLKESANPVKMKNDTKQAVKTCNEYLQRLATQCEIDKDITTYYARYSFANIAKSLGYSKDMIAEALGHEYGNRVTGIYLDNYDNNVIDAMVGRVIDLVFENK